jgi:hypothetical protein
VELDLRVVQGKEPLSVTALDGIEGLQHHFGDGGHVVPPF